MVDIFIVPPVSEESSLSSSDESFYVPPYPATKLELPLLLWRRFIG